MRVFIVPALAALAVAAAPNASAQIHQDFHDVCESVSKENRIAGALVGGVLGGVLGNEAAADGVRGEGAALGALLGSVAGAEIAKNASDCEPRRYGDPYRTSEYSDTYDPYDPYLYESASTQPYPDKNNRYGQSIDEYDLYGSPHESYGTPAYAPASVECKTVMRTTELPDGRALHEPVRACRKAYYGDWALDE